MLSELIFLECVCNHNHVNRISVINKKVNIIVHRGQEGDTPGILVNANVAIKNAVGLVSAGS